jgi:hypothetical protein
MDANWLGSTAASPAVGRNQARIADRDCKTKRYFRCGRRPNNDCARLYPHGFLVRCTPKRKHHHEPPKDAGKALRTVLGRVRNNGRLAERPRSRCRRATAAAAAVGSPCDSGDRRQGLESAARCCCSSIIIIIRSTTTSTSASTRRRQTDHQGTTPVFVIDPQHSAVGHLGQSDRTRFLRRVFRVRTKSQRTTLYDASGKYLGTPMKTNKRLFFFRRQGFFSQGVSPRNHHHHHATAEQMHGRPQDGTSRPRNEFSVDARLKE